MEPDQFGDLFATLATGGALALVGVVGLAVVSRSGLARLRDGLAGAGPALGSFLAGVATCGSLYFSEVAHFPPCRLCWVQRIFMYPLALILVLATVRRDGGIRPYGLALAGLGACVSTYHVLIELYPTWEGGSCDPTNPCSLRWVEGLGFWTLPRMALVTFLLVGTVLLLDGTRTTPGATTPS